MAYSRRRLQGRGIFYVFKLSYQDFGPERHQRIIVMFLQKHTMSRRTLSVSTTTVAKVCLLYLSEYYPFAGHDYLQN